MSNISPSTPVYLWVYHPPHSGQRAWLKSHEIVRNKLGDLVVLPTLDDDPATAVSMRYDLAVILKRRLETENVINAAAYSAHFSLSPTGEEVAGGNTTSSPTDDNRVVMSYRGILARPGISVNHGRCWFVKFPGHAIESVRGATPEEVVNMVYERNLQGKAEQAPPPPAPEPEQPTQKKKNCEGRLRPCAFNKRRDGYVA
jgi:hypothetical protein